VSRHSTNCLLRGLIAHPKQTSSFSTTGQHPSFNDSYVKDMVEQTAYCYELHEALSSQIRHWSQVEQQVAYDAACLEWQQPDKPNSVPMDRRLRKPFSRNVKPCFGRTPRPLKSKYGGCLLDRLTISPIPPTNSRFLVTFACYAMRSGLSLELDLHPKKDLLICEAKRVA